MTRFAGMIGNGFVPGPTIWAWNIPAPLSTETPIIRVQSFRSKLNSYRSHSSDGRRNASCLKREDIQQCIKWEKKKIRGASWTPYIRYLFNIFWSKMPKGWEKMQTTTGGKYKAGFYLGFGFCTVNRIGQNTRTTLIF